MGFFLQLLVSGLLLGAFYATTALGFSIIWGVMRLINLAHGEFLMMGAFVAWFFFNPTREQNLVFTVSDPTVLQILPETQFGFDLTFHATTLVAMGIIALIIALITSEGALASRMSATWARRAASIAVAESAVLALYSWWAGTGFGPVTVSLMFIIFAGLALALGFLISHVLLHMTLDWGTLWQRRLIGYPIGFAMAALAHYFWYVTNYPPIDPFGNLALMVFAGSPLVVGFLVAEVVLRRMLKWDMVELAWLVGIVVGAALSIILYVPWRWANLPPISVFGSLPILFVLFFALGYVIQNGFFNRLVGGPYLTMLLVTFAVSIGLQNFGLQIYAADPRQVTLEYGTAITLPLRLRDVMIAEITISPEKFLSLVTVIIMLAGLVLFLRYTRTGYAIRAAAQNEMAARLMGINIKEVYAITFAVSLGLTAMAGGIMATFQAITPVDGPRWTLRAFAMVALGGLGKVEGVVVGGLVLGLAESLVGGYISTGWAVATAFVMLVIMLVIRPQGITGGLVSAEE